MAHVTATFSNGHTDTYKGNREVTAAWMVVEVATGRVIDSGHSLTVQAAEKTAKASVPRAVMLPTGWRDHKNTPAGHRCAKSAGYRSPREMEQDYKRQNAEKAKQYRTEVVAL